MLTKGEMQGRGINQELRINLHMLCSCLVTKSCPTLLYPHGLQPTRLLCPWDFPGKNTGVGCHLPFLFPGDRPNPGIKPMSPALQADFFFLFFFFTTEPPGKHLHTLLNIKQITNKDLLYSTENCAQHSNNVCEKTIPKEWIQLYVWASQVALDPTHQYKQI